MAGAGAPGKTLAGLVQACERGLSSEQPFLWSPGWILEAVLQEAMEAARLYQQLLSWSRRPACISPAPAFSPVPTSSSVPASSPLSRSRLWSPSSCRVLGMAHCFSLPPLPHHVGVECLPSVFAFRFIQVPLGKPQFLPIDLNLNFLEKLHKERLGSHLIAEACGLAPVGPPLWAEFPLDRPRAPFQLLTLQGER